MKSEHTLIMKKLIEKGFEAYLVGGCVRDELLGLTPHDFDITTNAHPDEIIQVFKNKKCGLVGKTFGVVIVNGIEVATYRFDIHKNKSWGIEYADHLYQDLRRRDLTINALAKDTHGKIIDKHEGIYDLNNKIIRFVGSAKRRIEEDPCRILRACRFLAKINGRFNRKTFKALVDYSYMIKKVAPERVRAEILKAMEIKNASRFFEALHEIGILKDIFPSFEACWDHPHGNHHLESVSAHMLFSGDSVFTKYPIVKLAAYLHDCGKPESYDNIMKTFHDHENIGADLLTAELRKLTFANNEIEQITGLVKCHMGQINEMSPKALRKLHKKLNDNNIEVSDFLRIKFADRSGNIKKGLRKLSHWKNDITNLINPIIENTPFNVNDLAIKGKDLINEFALKPGPIVGKIQKAMLEFVIENGPEFNTGEELKKIVRKFI